MRYQLLCTDAQSCNQSKHKMVHDKSATTAALAWDVMYPAVHCHCTLLCACWSLLVVPSNCASTAANVEQINNRSAIVDVEMST